MPSLLTFLAHHQLATWTAYVFVSLLAARIKYRQWRGKLRDHGVPCSCWAVCPRCELDTAGTAVRAMAASLVWPFFLAMWLVQVPGIREQAVRGWRRHAGRLEDELRDDRERMSEVIADFTAWQARWTGDAEKALGMRENSNRDH